MPEKQNQKWLLIILVLAWVLRISFVFWLQNKLDSNEQKFLIAGDAAGYWELAKSIVNGEDYSVHDPPRFVHRMPGFPLLLSLSIAVFGESFFAARILLASIGAFTCFLVYLLGKQIHSQRVGLIAAALLAVSPAAIGFSGLILSETAFGCTMVLALLCLNAVTVNLRNDGSSERSGPNHVSGKRHSLWQYSLLTGFVVALGVYMKPSWVLTGPLVALLIVGLHKPRQRSLLVSSLILGGMLLILLPWGVRNQLVTGHFKLTTFWMGPSLYDGLNPMATGDSDMRFFDQDALALEMTEYEVDQEYKRRAIDFAQNNPHRVAELAARKLWRYWKPWPNANEFDKPLISIGLSLYTIPLLFLAVWGGWVVRGEFWSIVILAGPIFYFAGLHIIFVSSLRYRLPAEAPLSVLSAIGIVSICRNMPKK